MARPAWRWRVGGAAWLRWQNARDLVEKNFGWPSINAVFERYCRETVAAQRR